MNSYLEDADYGEYYTGTPKLSTEEILKQYGPYIRKEIDDWKKHILQDYDNYSPDYSSDDDYDD